MKKIAMMCMLVGCSLLLFGCGKYGEKDVIKDLTKEMDNMKGYHVTGTLTIVNNEDSYKYYVDASFKKENFYRVSLKNVTNNHEQIILKNNDGVYVLTPSLNKSFKFQSEWPFNSSQTYLFQTLLKDIKGDNKRKFQVTDKQYIFTTKVNYTSNTDLVNQKIYFDKKLNIQKVEVYNKDGNVQMKMEFKDVDTKASFKDSKFALKENMTVSNTDEEIATVSKIDDVIYPMYMPANTHLESQNTVKKGTKGERVIMNFTGDKSFMMVQETASKEQDMLTIPVFGEPIILTSSVAAVGDGSVSWMSNGIEYYVVSDTMSQDELLEVVKSVSVVPVGK